MKGIRYIPLLAYIISKINKNKNIIIVVNGQTGSGKTFLGLSLLEDLSKILGTNFSVKTNVDFEFKKLLRKMKLPENIKAGSCFLFEEVGAIGGGAAATEWQSKVNAMFGSFLQTSRVKRRILIMTCPNFRDLDAKARRLCHLRIEMRSINLQKKIGIAKCHAIQINPRTGVDYHKRLRFMYDGRQITFNTLEVRIPSKKILVPYEKMKNEYVDSLEKFIIDSDKPKEKKKREHKHTWRVRPSTNDRICRICGVKEPFSLGNTDFKGNK